jgi:hypothetical protein
MGPGFKSRWVMKFCRMYVLFSHRISNPEQTYIHIRLAKLCTLLRNAAVLPGNVVSANEWHCSILCTVPFLRVIAHCLFYISPNLTVPHHAATTLLCRSVWANGASLSLTRPALIGPLSSWVFALQRVLPCTNFLLGRTEFSPNPSSHLLTLNIIHPETPNLFKWLNFKLLGKLFEKPCTIGSQWQAV